MVRQQLRPVAIRSYAGLGVRLLAICESCWHVSELQIPALLNRLGEDCTTFDVKRSFDPMAPRDPPSAAQRINFAADR